jgi:hypothetical protein
MSNKDPWSNVQVKCDVPIFISLAVKAVHLELVRNLTSDSLPRFIARKGKCLDLYSDNGATFVGAHNELRECRKLFPSEAHQ